MPPKVTIKPNRAGIAAFRNDFARAGMVALMLDAETEAKRETPVRGGYRSFRPGTSPIGGTLRRSVHSAVYLDGRLVGSHAEAGGILDGLPAGRGIVGFVGTNTGYGAYVDLGTRKMAARPFLLPGAQTAASRGAATIRRAMARIGRA